jgi:hypothetical protein
MRITNLVLGASLRLPQHHFRTEHLVVDGDGPGFWVLSSRRLDDPRREVPNGGETSVCVACVCACVWRVCVCVCVFVCVCVGGGGHDCVWRAWMQYDCVRAREGVA